MSDTPDNTGRMPDAMPEHTEHFSSDSLPADASNRPHTRAQNTCSTMANRKNQAGTPETVVDDTLSGGKGGITYIAEQIRPLAVPVGSLVFDAANARKHNDRNMDAIKASLARWGQRTPIVVQRNGMIVRAGNGRLAAAKALGWTHIAAVVVDDSSIDAVAFAIADNRTAELAEWDSETLATLLDTLPKDVMPDTGFTDADLSTLLAGLTPPDFQPASIDEQGRLDQKAPKVCPECGHEWHE